MNSIVQHPITHASLPALKMTSSFSGRVFVVTGSASGMGLATAKPLLERGASLGLCDLNGASLEKLFNSLPEEQKSRVIIQIMTSRTAVL